MTTISAPARPRVCLAPFVAFGVLVSFALATFLPLPVATANVVRSVARTSDDGAVGARAATAYGQLPLRFEENVGQSDPRVRFLARTGAGTLFLCSEEIVLTQVKKVPRSEDLSKRRMPESDIPARVAALRMRFEGANPQP